MVFIVVGVTGGIAAYKTVQLVRLLVKAGHEVHVVPTPDALKFVGLTTWEAISRNPVTTSVHDDVSKVRHVALGQAADLVVIAPATANRLAKIAAGIADDLLGTTLLATKAPVIVAPAMHTEMWENAATQANVETLKSRGVIFFGPESGELTGGDSGPGRMTEPEDLFEAVMAEVSMEQDLAGLTVAVSTGGTREPLDPVRYLGNRSSGKQGAAVALAAARRGAKVQLVAAETSEGVLAEVSGHPGVELSRVATAIELQERMEQLAAGSDVIVMVAAVADYRPASRAEGKLSKTGDEGLTLELVQNPDILAGLVKARRDGQTMVGFAAETAAGEEELLDKGRRKRQRKGVDLLAVNEVGWDKGFESGENSLTVLDARDEIVARATGSKLDVAHALWDAVVAIRA